MNDEDASILEIKELEVNNKKLLTISFKLSTGGGVSEMIISKKEDKYFLVEGFYNGFVKDYNIPSNIEEFKKELLSRDKSKNRKSSNIEVLNVSQDYVIIVKMRKSYSLFYL